MDESSETKGKTETRGKKETGRKKEFCHFLQDEGDSEKESRGNSFFEWLVKKFYELPASVECRKVNQFFAILRFDILRDSFVTLVGSRDNYGFDRKMKENRRSRHCYTRTYTSLIKIFRIVGEGYFPRE